MSIPNEHEIYNIVKEYLSRHGKLVRSIEKLDSKTMNEYEQSNPSLEMIAYKLMLFAEEQRIEKESIIRQIQIIKNDLEKLEASRSEEKNLTVADSDPMINNNGTYDYVDRQLREKTEYRRREIWEKKIDAQLQKELDEELAQDRRDMCIIS